MEGYPTSKYRECDSPDGLIVSVVISGRELYHVSPGEVTSDLAKATRMSKTQADEIVSAKSSWFQRCVCHVSELEKT